MIFSFKITFIHIKKQNITYDKVMTFEITQTTQEAD